MSAKVIKLPVKQQSHVGNLSDLDNDLTKQVRVMVNARVRDYIRQGGKLNRLALKANLTVATVSRLAYYETTRPMWRTIISVMEALELYEDIGKLMIAYGRKKR